MKKYQNGFHAILIILILLGVGIVGFTGYKVYHLPKNTSKETIQNKTTHTCDINRKYETEAAQNYLQYQEARSKDPNPTPQELLCEEIISTLHTSQTNVTMAQKDSEGRIVIPEIAVSFLESQQYKLAYRVVASQEGKVRTIAVTDLNFIERLAKQANKDTRQKILDCREVFQISVDPTYASKTYHDAAIKKIALADGRQMEIIRNSLYDTSVTDCFDNQEGFAGYLSNAQ